MKDQRIWHGIRFTFDAYYEFHHSIDQCMQIDIISKEVVDEQECLLWEHGVPETKAQWSEIENEFICYISVQIEEDIELDRQERQVDRMLIEREMQYDDYRPYY